MKVLFHSYNTCFQNPSAGIKVRISKIRELLLAKGIEVDFFNPVTTKLTDYEVLHIFKLTYETFPLIVTAKKTGLKIVVSPIVNLDDGKKIDVYFKFLNKLPLPTTYKLTENAIKLVDLFLVETPKERIFISKHFNISTEIIHILPNGVDGDESEIKYDESKIFETIGHRSKYILQVGRINENKNVYRVIKAIGPTGIDLVIIGGPDKNNGDEYFEKCLNEGQKYKNVHFLGWVDNKSELLRSAYKNAEVLVLSSFQETFGLVLLEAAMAGAKLAISNTLPILDFDSFKKCRTFKPGSVDEIRNTVLQTFADPKESTLRERILEEFLWDNIINRLIKDYEVLLG